jgi:hypothetical protein
MTEIHEGGCNCGAVRYKTLAAPQRVGACACSWCQKRTGSAFGISVYFQKSDVEITGGPLRTYRAWSDAGRWLDSEFCETCGTTVTWTLEFFPDFRGIAGGSFDRPTFWYELERFVFARTKPDWLQLPEGIEVHEAMPK